MAGMWTLWGCKSNHAYLKGKSAVDGIEGMIQPLCEYHFMFDSALCKSVGW